MRRLSGRWRRRLDPGNFRRWWSTRCAACGRRRRLVESWHGYGGAEVWHDACMSAQSWRRTAHERLTILALVAEVWEVDAATVRELASIRGTGDLDSSKAWDLAFRVFYDLERTAPKLANQETP